MTIEQIVKKKDFERDIYELQARYENGDILESELMEEELEQLCHLYDKQCRDIEAETNRILRNLAKTFFEIIVSIVAKHCGMRKTEVRLKSSIRIETEEFSYVRRRLFKEMESAFEIEIGEAEMDKASVVEDLLDLALRKKGILDLR